MANEKINPRFLAEEGKQLLAELQEERGAGACQPERQEWQPWTSNDRAPLVPGAKAIPISRLGGLGKGQTPDFEEPQPKKKKPAKPAGKGSK